MKRLLVAALLTLGLGLSGFAKTIAFGTSETITEDITLDENLIVDGNLDIIGATVTLTKNKYVIIGRENSQTYANFNIKNGSLVMQSAGWDSYVILAQNGGHAHMKLDNATMRIGRMAIAHNTQWCRADVVLTNNSSMVLSAGPLNLNAKGNEATPVGNTLKSSIKICEGCRIEAVSVQGTDNWRCGFYFAGGTLATRYITPSDSCKLFLKGVNGHPIRLEYLNVPSDPASYLFHFSGSDSRMLVGAESPDDLTPVDCAFVKLGVIDVPLVAPSRVSQLTLAYSGGTRIEAGGTTLTAANQLPMGGDVHVSAAATVKLGGFDQTWGSFTGGGVVKNEGDTAVTVTLDVPENTAKTLSGTVSGNATLVKTGVGKLVAEKDVLDGLTVKAGQVEVADPSVVGYPEYEFIVDRPYGNTYTGLAYSDVDLYAGDVRRTAPYEKVARASDLSCTDVKNVLDHDTATTWWVNCRYNGVDYPQIGDRGYVDLSYALAMKLTAFTWTTYPDTDPTAEWCRDPGAWRLRGRYHGGEWVTLHSMTNKGYALMARSTETEKFPLVYPTAATLTAKGVVFEGGSLSFDGDVALKVPFGETFTATGSDVVFSALAVDCAAQGGTIVGGTVAATGKLWLTGVETGTLKSGMVLPLTFNGTAKAAGESSWPIYVDGVLDPKHWAVFANGKFTVTGQGMLLLFR